MTTNILPTQKERRVDLLDIPGEMTDPSYIDALAGMIQTALDHRAGGENLTTAEAREVILFCIAEGIFRPQGWKRGTSENVR